MGARVSAPRTVTRRVATRELQQLVHGYRRGHEQLAGSIKLPTRDAELITRLSDLSGNLSGSPKFSSYLTVYPLPSGDYFALGRTWPDTNAPRAGCVLTHTILVPTFLWGTLAEPRALDGLFSFPSSSNSTSAYTSPISVPTSVAFKTSGIDYSDQPALLVFVRRYFGEGMRPLIWFGQDQPEEILWRLLRALWPKLRATFSACTFCLQPRTLEDRPFELMFAPSVTYSRFGNIKAEHFIEATSRQSIAKKAEKTEQWYRTWTKHLFGTLDLEKPTRDPELWAELDEDPTTIRRLFLIEGLTETANPTPQVFVGVMDLVESLAKSPNSAVGSKRRAAERAVHAAWDTDDPNSSLECLLLIEERLARPSFSSVPETVGPVLRDAVASLTRKDPEVTVQSFLSLPAHPDPNNSWFGRGLLEGLRTLANEEPSKLLVLRKAPTIVSYLLRSEPGAGAAFIRATAARREDPEIRSELLRWLGDVPHSELRRTLGMSLVSMLGPDDVDILDEILRDLRAKEVNVVLDALWRQTNRFETSRVRELIIRHVARRYPSETRAWTRTLSQWMPTVAQVSAATYPATRQGLLELLNTESSPGGQRAEMMAAFMDGFGPDPYPNWFMEIAREQSAVLSSLLEASVDPSSTLVAQTQKLLNEASALPIASSPSLPRLVLNSSAQPFFGTLLDVTMRSLISAYIAGVADEAMVRTFQENPKVAPWFNGIERWDLKSLVTRDTWSSPLHWLNAWRWIATAPSSLYRRESTLLQELIDSLCPSHHLEWSQQISDAWVQILSRVRLESHNLRQRLLVCVQALKFSLNNVSLPLGSVVVEVFQDVYAAVTDSPTVPAETFPLFSIFDWDKGKELRRNLVDSFLRSQWPPGDLVLAVADERLLRKIFKRLLRRPGGETYAKAALADIKARTDERAAGLGAALQDMLANPNFYEEWV